MDVRLAEIYEEGGTTERWWYLSFTDSGLPKGQQFLGGVYLRAWHEGDAVVRSHRLNLNPGGGVRILGPILDDGMENNVPKEKRYRLLTAEEVNG